MHALRSLLIALLFLSCTLSQAANPGLQRPQQMVIFGGNGGGDFKLECPNNFEGVVIRRGAWISGLGLICSGRRLAMTGGTRDQSEEWSCPGGGTVSSLKYGFTRDGNYPKYLDYLEVHCARGEVHCFHTGDGCWDRHPNPGSYNGRGLTHVSTCSSFQHGYGIVGRSGDAIDALGVECFPAPPPRPPIDHIRPLPPRTPLTIMEPNG